MAYKRDRSAFELEGLIELLMAQGCVSINSMKLRLLEHDFAPCKATREQHSGAYSRFN